MAVNKHTKNRLLNDIGEAVAAMRRALETAEKASLPDEASEIEEEVESLIDLSNQVEGL